MKLKNCTVIIYSGLKNKLIAKGSALVEDKKVVKSSKETRMEEKEVKVKLTF